jgi:(E)-4-hydroxy-3-methylbut-2-enyl-diphosphate synthase
MALAAIEAGVAKLRLNPGNIRDPKKTREVVSLAKERGTPIRIGVNLGSLDPDLEKRFGLTPEAMVESALRHVEILEDLGHTDIIISLKAHDVATTVYAYRLMDARLRERQTPYALHLGITEAGLLRDGTIKSSIGLGILLWEGIGDTMRVSLAADPLEEVPVVWGILKSLGLREKGFEITACPSCGRAEIDVLDLGRSVEAIAKEYTAPVKVAVMGCVVNGPGESKMADVGVAGGKGKGAIYRKGELVGTFAEAELLGALRREIEKVISEQYPEFSHELRGLELGV